jgi:UDP-glucose 4-epimerase
VALRFFNVYGPRQDPTSDYSAVIPKFIDRLRRNERPVIFGDGKQTRDFVYVRDIVQANILAMQGPATGVFNIGSGLRTDLNVLANTVSGVMGVSLPPVHEKPRTMDIRDSVSDITSARTTLGFEPKYSLSEGLAEIVRGLSAKN